MTSAALIERLASLDVRYWKDDGRLRVSAPDGVLTPELVDALRTHKAALLAALTTTTDPSGPHPLSFAQERLWFLETMGGVGPAYNVAGAVRINGDLDVEALAHALTLVQQRQQMLRVRVIDVDGTPAQTVAPAIEVVTLERREWQGDAAGALDAARADAQRPFDITRDALIRATVHEIGPTDALLAVTMHHLISDGASLGVLIREWMEAHAAVREHRTPAWSPLVSQYVDYARAQRDASTHTRFERHIAYWREQLDDASDVITLPVDHPRPPTTSFRGRALPVRLSPATGQGVMRLAGTCDATPVMVLLAAWAHLLMRTSGQDEVVIGVPVSGRPADGADDLVGLFVNALPIRVQATSSLTCAGLVDQVKTRVLDAMTHGDVPWEFLLEALQPRRDVSRSPIFQVSFTLQDNPLAAYVADGLTLTDVPLPVDAAKFELSLELQPAPEGGYVGVLEFNTDLFASETAARLVERYVHVVDTLVSAPDAPLDGSALWLPGERDLVEAAWCGPQVPFDLRESVPEVFTRIVETQADAPAIVVGDRVVTFAALHERARQVGAALVSRGVTVGAHVGVVVDRTPETISHLLGVLYAGAAYVPIDPAWPDQRRTAVVEAAGCAAVIDPMFVPEGAASLPQVSMDSAAYVLFTSGSTGVPKGVVVEHRSLRHLIEALEFSVYQPLGIRSRARVSVNGALTFDTSIKQVFQLLQGRTLVLVPEDVRRDGAALLSYARAMSIEVLDVTPSQLTWLVDAGLPTHPGPVRAVLAGGEALSSGLWHTMRVPGAPVLVNLYGPTECTVDATVHILSVADEVPLLGRPLPNMAVCVLDSALQPVPVGTPGELVIAGPGVARGYVGDPDATTARFVPNPWPDVPGARLYRTGDRGRVRPDGRLEFLGRVDDQVKVRGHRVELGEVERGLAQHDAVRAACALVTDDHRLVAAVAVDPLRSPSCEGRERHTLANGLSIVHLNRNESDFLYSEMFEKNAYLRHGVHLHDDATVVDVGSNIGMFALFAHVRHANIRLVCIEPNPHVRELLEANLRLFGADARVFACGIAETEAQAEFTYYPGFSILSGLHADVADEAAVVRSYIRQQRDLAGSDDSTVEEVIAAKLRPVALPVQLRPLGDVIAECGLTRIDLLKVNVEKAELEVLLGLCDEQWAMIRQVALELHDVDGRLQTTVAMLRERGFEVAVDEDWSLEQQAGTNYYLYAVRPGEARAETMSDPSRLERFTVPLVKGDEILATTRAHVPDYMVPEACRVVDRLPLTSHGKVDRRRISRWSWTRSGGPGGESARPLSETEARLAALWSQVLDVERVNADDQFFECGGHSLSAARLAGRVRETFGVAFTVGAVFDAPVLADMAAHIATLAEGVVPLALQAHGWEGEHPVSFAQERLLFLEQLDGGGAAYVIAGAMTLEGSLDVAALRQALVDVVDRHPVLRSGFSRETTPPVARLLPHHVELTLEDWSARQVADVDTAVQEWVMARSAVAFDLTSDLPLRVTLLRITADHHVLAVACHHVVADGWSVALFLRDLSSRYRAHIGLADAGILPPLPVGYYDHARWQRNWLCGARLESEVTFWRTTLAGAAPSLDLPTDRPRPSVTTYDGHALSWVLPPETRRRVEQVARHMQTTPYTVLLAVFAALLHRWTGRHDIVIGSPVAGRTVPGTDDLIGLFVNTVAMRIELEGVTTFAELLVRSRQVTRDALDHQDLPFELVVDAVKPPRRLDRHPVFQVMFALQNLPVATLELPGVRWAPLPVPSTVARFDLSLVVDEVDDGYRATCEYATALFDASTIARLGEWFTRLVDAVCEDTSTPVATAPLAGADDLARIRAWNDTAHDYGPFVPVHQQVAAQAQATPDAIALTWQGTAVTYAEMMRRARHVASVVRRHVQEPGAVVALCTDRSPAWVVAVLGILDAGAVFLPIDPDFPAERVRWMLKDSGAALVLSQYTIWPELIAAAAEPIMTPVVLLDDIPFDGAPTVVAPAESGPDDAAYVIYTSGSTGQPKGAVNAHRGFTNLLRNFVECFETSASTKALHVSSISFDSSLCEVFMALVAGGTAVLAAREEILPGEPLERVLRDRRITHATIPPSALGSMADSDLPDLEVLISAGEVCPPEVVQGWGRTRRFFNAYGPTESSVCCLVAQVHPGQIPVPVGRPLRNVQVYVVDAARACVPVGMPGEIAIGGVGVAHGYLRRPELTTERFVDIEPYADGERVRVYLTGDQGRQLPDGQVEFLGRQDTQVKLRGYRIELGEIESAFRGHPGVRDCAVVVQNISDGQKRLVAFVVGDGDVVVPKGLKEHLRMRLPEYMVPPLIVGLERIPQTTGGKRDTRALEQWDVSVVSAQAESPGDVAASPTTQTIAGIFADVLGLDSFGPRDDFFEHGGHSLLAARVIGRVRDLLGVELTLRSLFEGPTPERLAVIATQGAQAIWPPLVAAGSQSDQRVMSPAQRRLWFIDQLGTSDAYTIVAAVRLTGTMDLPAFRAAVLSLSQRHEVLRTAYPATNGEPRMVVTEPVPLRISRVTGGDLWEAALAQATDDARQPFDLATGPLFRPVLYHLSADDHLFVASMHHIVSDGWSIGVLVRDLADAYLGTASAPPLQYADYTSWWQQTFEGVGRPRLDQQLDFWRRRLAGVATQLALPVDHPRPAVMTSRGATVAFSIPSDVVAALDALGRQTNTSRFVVLLSAFMAWLSRLSGQESFVVGTPVANRRDTKLESVVGLFANTLPLRADVSSGHSFREYLVRQSARIVDDLSHPDVPFDLIVQAMDPVRDFSRSPLFQVMCAMSSGLVPPLRLPGLQIAPVTLPLTSAKFDLTLFVDDEPDATGLNATLEYNADLFEAETARRCVRGFSALLQNAISRPDVPIGDLHTMSDADLATLESWNGTSEAEVAAPTNLTPVIDLFEAQVARSQGQVAIEWESGTETYEGLDRRANRLARMLAARGVSTGSTVAVCLARSPELVVALLAVWKAGGAFVPIDPQYPPERQAFMVRDVGALVLVTTSELAARLSADDRGASSVVAIDAEAQVIARWPPVPVARTTQSTDLAYVIYTSGSTGTPKGVLIEHGGLSNYLTWAVTAYEMRAGHGAPVIGSIAFDATITSVFGPLLAGQRLILVPEGSEIDALAGEAVDDAEHSFWKITPSHLDAVNAGLEGRDLAGRVRHLVVGGEALQASTLRPWAERASDTIVTNEYGPTEAVVGCVVYTRPVGEMPTDIVPIGRPIPNTEIHLLDNQQRPVPIGAVGEICIAGAGVARGYHARPELTAERFVEVSVRRSSGAVVRRRCYRTGDLARWNASGQLEYLGRIDAQVKLRGHRVELGEIESVALRDDVVAQAAAVVQPGADAVSDRLVLYVVASAERELDVSALLSRLRSTLPPVMVPTVVRTIDALPLTPNGKLDRAALAAREDRAALAPGAITDAADALRALVADGWRQVLGTAPDHPDADFFASGGHSLLAAQLVARIRAACDVDLPVRAVFDHPTWRALTDEVAARRSGGAKWPPLVRTSDPPVLSFGQERLWALEQFDDTGTAYHIPAVFRLQGALDVVALQAAWHDVVIRHDVLRLRIPAIDGRPQPADVESFPSLVLIEDAGLAADAVVAERLSLPFSCETGPLVRAILAQESETAWILGVVLHHVVSDGWSSGVLVRDLQAAYARHRGLTTDPPPPSLPVQYADFAAWQRRVLQGESLERLSAYWTSTLEGAPTVLALPLDHPRGARQRYDGGVVTVRLDHAQLLRLQQCARDQHVTVYMVMLSAFAALLAQWSQQDDVVVGTTVANRSQPGTEGLIGFFVNTLPIRLRFTDGLSVSDLLTTTRSAALDALDHQALPFERLVDLLAHERNPSVSPIVQALFTHQHAGAADLNLPGVAVTPLPRAHASAKFDLTLAADERPEGVDLFFEYRTDLFDEATIRLVADRFVVGLNAMAADPAMSVAAIPFLTDDERLQLAAWNATEHDYNDSRLIHECFEAEARRRPEAVALTSDDRVLTYGELNRMADEMAARLRACGVWPDVLVGVCLERSCELFVALFGILKAGGAYVPLDPEYPRRRLADMCTDADVQVIVTTATLVNRGVLADTDPSVRHVLIETTAETVPSDVVPALRPQLDHLAYCIFTSGSTGRPKGAAIPHRAIQNRLLWMQEAFPLNESDVILHKTPIGFDVSVWELFWPLMCGASVAIARPGGHRDAAYLAGLIADRRVTTVHFVPSMLQAFLEEPSVRAFPSLRRIIVSGEALSWETARQCSARLGCPLHNLYGPTEAAVDVTAWPVVLGEAPHAIPIGRPIANTRIHILDRHQRRVPIGVPGELCIGGVNLARGYVNRPELTTERFVTNPFASESGEGPRLYRTGDLARWRSDGQIEYLGRLDTQVKLRGFRIELGEIDTTLRRHPSVADAAAHVTTGDRLVACVVPAREQVVNESALREYLRQHLPEYMVPTSFVTMEALPLGPSGKLDRRALPAPMAPAVVSAEPPRTAEEQTLAAIWADVTGRASIAREDNFFDIGGDSIRAIQVAARARRAGLHVTPALLLEHQTLAALSAAATTVGDMPPDDDAMRAEQGLLSGAVRPAPIVHWFVELGLESPHHFNQSLILQTPPGLAPDIVERALRQLSEHHDALRLRLVRTPAGIMVWYSGIDDGRVFRHESLEAVSPAERRARVEAIANGLQETLDPVDGPLWRAVYVTFGPDEPGRLIWTIHHLGVDGVSWGTLAGDLADVCRDLEAGRAPDLGAKTHSWRQWVQTWADAARSGTLDAQKSFWLTQPYALGQPAPTRADAGTAVRHDRVPLRQGGGISQDEVLAALWTAWTEVTGHDALAVDIERHGRVSPDGALDVSRTVGWFTSIHPLVFVPAADADVVTTVGRTVAAVPHTGAGFGALKYLAGDADFAALPRSPVLFNFLGDVDVVVEGRHGFLVSDEDTGPSTSSRNRSPYVLEVVAGVSAGHLHLHWRSPVAGLGDEVLDALASATARRVGEAAAPQPAMDADAGRARIRGPIVRLREVQPGDDSVPLFLVHPAGGTVLCYATLARQLPMPVFGLTAPGLRAGEVPVRSVDALAQQYIDAMVAAFPDGPLRLGGWSYGGVVAAEMARRLQAAGRVVEWLAIFDTLAPGAMPAGEWQKDSATLLADIFGTDAGVDSSELAGLPLEAQLQIVVRRAVASGILPEEYSMADAERAWAVFQAHRQAEQTFRPTRSFGHALVFSSDLRRADADPTLGWSRWLHRVDVVEVPGTHLDVLRPPVVDQVAACLRAACRTRV